MAPLLPQRLRRDPERSFERLYRTYVRDVYSFALALLGNVHDAEDVTQTTFLNAYRALERGERVRNMRPWLLAVAHNLCRQRFRTASRRPKEVELDPELADSFGEDDAPSAQEIREALGKLAFNQRTVLVLRELEGLSYDEIAQAMGLSRSAVETLLFRARRAIREQLEAAESDLGCSAVERLISLGLDGKLSRKDRGLLRAHLRACSDCARLARSQRARARGMPALVALPLPAALSQTLQPAGAGFFASKAAAVAASAALVGTGALVTTGVVPVPGKADGKRGEAVVEPGRGKALAPVTSGFDLSASPEEATDGSADPGVGKSGLPRAPEGMPALPSLIGGGGVGEGTAGGPDASHASESAPLAGAPGDLASPTDALDELHETVGAGSETVGAGSEAIGEAHEAGGGAQEAGGEGQKAGGEGIATGTASDLGKAAKKKERKRAKKAPGPAGHSSAPNANAGEPPVGADEVPGGMTGSPGALPGTDASNTPNRPDPRDTKAGGAKEKLRKVRPPAPRPPFSQPDVTPTLPPP